MAGRQCGARGLLGRGYQQRSMPPAAIGPVKSRARALDVGRLRARLLPRLEPGRWPGNMRTFLSASAEDHDIPL